jgi:hypothetical protein
VLHALFSRCRITRREGVSFRRGSQFPSSRVMLDLSHGPPESKVASLNPIDARYVCWGVKCAVLDAGPPLPVYPNKQIVSERHRTPH